jgi:uncharacterized protein (TIGR00725 family)
LKRGSSVTRSDDPIYIGVIGAGEFDERICAIAEEVGWLIGEAGAYLVCGGLGGVMEAACRGAKAGGGTTIGILPTESRSVANPYVDIALPTGIGEMRNALIVRFSDVLIAVDGEFGTLSEISFALKTGRPVVGIDTWTLAKPEGSVDAIERVDTAEAAVKLALDLARS